MMGAIYILFISIASLCWATQRPPVTSHVLKGAKPNSSSKRIIKTKLPPNKTGLAIDSIGDFDSGDRILPNEIVNDPELGRITLTGLRISFLRSATVENVNDVLSSIGGQIVSTLEHNPVLVVRIPNAGTVRALKEIVRKIKLNPSVRSASIESPSGYPPD